MSIESRWSGVRKRWGQRTRKLRRTLQQGVGLDRWYPQVPLALAHAPLGLLLIVAFADAELGVSLASAELAHLERQIPGLDHHPRPEPRPVGGLADQLHLEEADRSAIRQVGGPA